jgi:hypothetical protein
LLATNVQQLGEVASEALAFVRLPCHFAKLPVTCWPFFFIVCFYCLIIKIVRSKFSKFVAVIKV